MDFQRITVRLVREEDCRLLFDWRDKNPKRKTTLNANEISYDDHVEWFRRRLGNENVVILIFEYNDIPVGQCRCEKKPEGNEISISVDRDHRGKGLGKEVLKRAVEYFENNRRDIFPIMAYIRPENEVSQRTFMGAGFEKGEQINKNEYTCIRFRKDLKD